MKILIWILILGLSGCQNTGKSKQTRNLNSTKWIFVGLNNGDTKTYETVPEDLSGMNISFDSAHHFQAASSCNTLYGSFVVSDQQSIRIDSLSMTKMFCIDSLQTTWEDKYIAGLKNSSSFEIRKDTLSIKTGATSEMIFKAEPKEKDKQ